MGLDQFVFYYIGRKPNSKTNFKNNDEKELFHWRKHYKLDEWMFDLYQQKGGTKTFNSQKVWLSQKDILDLKNEILNNNFFDDEWELEDNEEQKVEDLDFCNKALEKIEQRYQIYYTNWW